MQYNFKRIVFSDNYGESWTLKNLFTCPNLPIKGITGGRQDGELYLLVEYLQMMGQRRHVYINHSLDYGEHLLFIILFLLALTLFMRILLQQTL